MRSAVSVARSRWTVDLPRPRRRDSSLTPSSPSAEPSSLSSRAAFCTEDRVEPSRLSSSVTFLPGRGRAAQRLEQGAAQLVRLGLRRAGGRGDALVVRCDGAGEQRLGAHQPGGRRSGQLVHELLVAGRVRADRLEVTRAWAEVTRTKELVPPIPAATHRIAAQLHLVRHGETQGYSTESGLTPLGGWQCHRRGFDLSKGVRDGEQVRIVCADTNRARQTAEHLHRGLLDGLELWRRDAKIEEPRPMAEFRNFQVATPEGLRDVTSAFRIYHAVMERYERVALGDRPMWLVELDRFWNVQQGGADPIHHWMTIPMLHFEPPASSGRSPPGRRATTRASPTTPRKSW